MHPKRGGDVLSLASFIALGLPDGMLGTAWPEMRQSFSAPVADLGLILLLSTAGSVVVTLFVGRLLRRAGVAGLLAAGGLCAAAAAVGFSVSPGLGATLGISILFGVAAGMMDAGLNTAVGLSGRKRLLNLLHGAYGIGTAVGPLVVTVAVINGSWRPAYLVLLAVDVGVAGCWLLLRRRERRWAGGTGGRSELAAAKGGAGDDGPSTAVLAPPTSLRHRPAIAAGISVFFLYTGLEVGAGQWETTFARDHLHLSTSAAGLATFGYWGALTAVRIGLALLPRAPAAQTVVRWGTGTALAATGFIWWDPVAVVAVVAFVVLGGALAGVFPALIGLTPARLGSERAQHVIGWQVGAAAAGGAALSALIGLIVGRSGLGAVGPAVTVLAAALLIGERVLHRLAPAA